MIDDLIPRAAAVRALASSNGDYLDALERLEKIPAVDAAPVVHARWRKLKDDSEECTNCLGLCPHEENYNGDIIFNFGCEYCPWCGAKMDGERRESE